MENLKLYLIKNNIKWNYNIIIIYGIVTKLYSYSKNCVYLANLIARKRFGGLEKSACPN